MTHIYFSARAEGRISYGHLGRTDSCFTWRVIPKRTSCAGGRHNMPAPSKFTFDLVTLKVVCETRATWPTSVPNLVFLGLSVLDLDPIIIIIIIIKETDLSDAITVENCYSGTRRGMTARCCAGTGRPLRTADTGSCPEPSTSALFVKQRRDSVEFHRRKRASRAAAFKTDCNR